MGATDHFDRYNIHSDVMTDTRLFVNDHARDWTCPLSVDPDIADFHHSVMSIGVTPLIEHPTLASQLGIKHLFMKDESQRANLPAFKILGASWATYKVLLQVLQCPHDTPLDELSKLAKERSLKLYAATDGNHGRAVARMARILELQSEILVPKDLDHLARSNIVREGAVITEVQGDYDCAVKEAKRVSDKWNGILVQDTAFEDYTEIPQWIVDGYTTMMFEVQTQLNQAIGRNPTLVVVPVGVGSFAQTAVSFWKSRPYPCLVVTVEPDAASCLKTSLQRGSSTTIPTYGTIMDGLNCGTVSTIAWPILKQGVDASVSVSDTEVDTAVRMLASLGMDIGPCGAATYVAINIIVNEDWDTFQKHHDHVVVLISTEGHREYALRE